MFDNDDLTLSTFEGADSLSWRPTRPIADWRTLQDRNNILRLKKIVISVPPTVSPLGANGVPLALLSCSATESPSKQKDGTIFSLVSINFTRDPSDTDFARVNIWFTGYKGNVNPTLMASTNDSPFSFLCETTGESVIVTLQPVGSSGATADLSFAITTTVLLDGVISAPPAPSIAQGVVTTPTGLQFTFTQEAGLLADVIQSYKVYHNTTNSSGSATVYQTIPQDPSNVGGQVVVQEALPNGTIKFYWVSAVNTSGLESSLTAVTGGGIPSGFAASGDNLVRNGDFSAGLSNWTGSAQASEIVQGVSNLPVGNSEFKSSRGPFTLTTDDFIPIDPTKSYLVSCWMKLANSGAIQYGGVFEYDSSKSLITHVTAGSTGAYCLFSALNQVSPNTGGNELTTNGWQFFAGIISGPVVSPSSSPAPTPYQFATGTVYIKPIILVNNSGTPQQVEICNFRISAVEAVTTKSYLKASGLNLMSSSDFAGGSLSFLGGLSSAYSVYDNNSTGHVTLSTVADTTAPNSSGYKMRVSISAGGENPGLGGFYVGLTVDSGTSVLGSYHKSNRLLFRFKALLPDKSTIHYAANASGDGSTTQWITDQYGRGVWRDYMVLITPGTSGSFSSIGFFWLDTTVSTPLTFDVATFEAVDIDQASMSGNTYQLYRQGISTSLLTQGSVIPTQAFTITYTTTTTSISLSWSSASLYRSDGSTFTVASGSKNYTSLSSSTQYFIYPYIDLINNVIAFTNATPPGTSLSTTLAVQTLFDNRSGLSALVITTPSAGTGGGTGGDGGSGGGTPPCPDQNELVEVMRNGEVLQIKAGEIVAETDLVKGYSFADQKDVYRRVLNMQLIGCAAWRIVDGHKVTPCEPIYKNGQWMPAYKAPGATVDYSVGIRVNLTVDVGEDEEHNYWLVGDTPLLIHNFFVLPC